MHVWSLEDVEVHMSCLLDLMYVCVCARAHMHTFINTDIHKYIHTHIHTYSLMVSLQRGLQSRGT
jgi:hypothetical protein